MFRCVIFLVLATGGQSANILGVFMYPAVSHQVLYQKICTELSLRGHQVTILTPHPLNNPNLTNLTEISISFINNIMKDNHVQEQYSKDITAFQVFKNSYHIFDNLAEIELDSPQLKEFVSDPDKTFDLILIHIWHPVMYGLAARYKAPIIAMSSLDVFSITYDLVGNPTHPVLYPQMYFNFQPKTVTFLEKLESFLLGLQQKYYHYWVFLPHVHQMARKYFGKVPYIGDLEKTLSVLFVYRNLLLAPPRSNLPTVTDLYFVNNEPSKTLPEDLQTILDGASNGAIYISFGSNVKTERFGKNLKDGILEALSELPYTILLKWNFDLFDKPSNLVVRKWFPQRDVLAHPNVKVFVTQGGIQSIEEAILEEVPLVGIPFMIDQPRNVRTFVELGIGEKIDPTTVTKTVFRNTITKVAENISYKEKIKGVRKILLDRSRTSLDSAVWWCEYVIRHKGTKRLRSSAVDMSYFEYFLVDVILFLVFSFIFIFCAFIMSCKLLLLMRS